MAGWSYGNSVVNHECNNLDTVRKKTIKDGTFSHSGMGIVNTRNTINKQRWSTTMWRKKQMLKQSSQATQSQQCIQGQYEQLLLMKKIENAKKEYEIGNYPKAKFILDYALHPLTSVPTSVMEAYGWCYYANACQMLCYFDGAERAYKTC